MFQHKFLYHFGLFFKGAFMGLANKIPGVSGGAVAYMLGFYDVLITSFTKLNRHAFHLLKTQGLKSFSAYVNGSFLGTVLLGIVFSFFTVSKLLDYFLLRFELYVWALFFGLIIGSALYLIGQHKYWTSKSYGFLFVGLILGFMIHLMPQGQENHNIWFVFFCGIVSVSGITIPGLSGSYILMLMGNYVYLLVDNVNSLSYILSRLFQGDFSVLNKGIYQESLGVLFVFLLGSLMGLILFSQLLGYVIKKNRRVMEVLVIGFMIGSLGTVWPWKYSVYKDNVVVHYQKYIPNLFESKNQMALGFIIFGLFLVLGIERFSNQTTKHE